MRFGDSSTFKNGGRDEMDVHPYEGKLLGLFELDDEGKVLYCSLESPEGSMKREAAFEG